MRLWQLEYRPEDHEAWYNLSQPFLTPYQAESYWWINYGSDCGNALTSVRVSEMLWDDREAHWQTARTPLPWLQETFWRYGYPIHEYHYAHVSEVDPSMLAFTMTPEHGERDIQTRMRPGKYLTKYFVQEREKLGLDPLLTPKQIAFLSEWFATGLRPVPEMDVTLAFATTPDEIAAVYQSGPSSCMDRRHFSDASTMPVRVYGAGDLAVAHLLDNASGDVIARALCWPEKKGLGRVYPTPDNWKKDGFESYEQARSMHDYLLTTLKKQGYRYYTEDDQVLVGARLLKTMNPSGDFWVMPYVDKFHVNDDPGDGFFRLAPEDNGDYAAKNTNGLLEDEDADFNDGANGNDDDYTCDRCDDGCDETYTVYTEWSRGRARGAQSWCYSCEQNRSFYCDGAAETFTNRLDRVDVDGSTYCRDWFDDNGGYYCDGEDEYKFEDDDPKVEMAGGDTWCQSWFEDNGFTCAADGRNYDNDEMSTHWPGFHVDHDDNAEISFDERIRGNPSNCEDKWGVVCYKRCINDYNPGVAPWDYPGRGLAKVRTVHVRVYTHSQVSVADLLADPITDELIRLTA